MTTTTITSTGTRQTQNLTISSAQNTAPILEFRCLYTHDLRRKQKRWQDGLLRFHTFNKRVMVYDVPRNYIGDTHYRHDGVLQDGDELELDRGVLIQVGEATGSMEQDLTEILGKKRKPRGTAPCKDASSPMRECPAVATARPPMGQPSQLRPKSLNALLGTPQRLTGRASLPMKSPYEIRQENRIPASVDERPAKRQRLNTQSKRLVHKKAVPAIQTHTPSRLPDNSSIQKNVAANSVPNRQVSMPHAPNPSDEGNGEPASKTESRLAQLRGRPSHGWETTETRRKVTISKQPRDGVTSYDAAATASLKGYECGGAKRKVRGNHSKHRDFISGMDENTSSSPLRDSRTPCRTKPAVAPIEINSDSDTFATCKSPKERMRLQIASRKPRRKLIYRDLLPQGPPAIGRPSSGRASTGQGSRESSVSTTSNRRPKKLWSDYNQEKGDGPADRPNGNYRQEYHRTAENNASGEKRVRSPGLFLSQEDNPHLAASPHKTKGRKQKTRKLTSPGQYVGDIANHIFASRSLDPQKGTIPETSTIRETALTLSKMDEILFSGTRHQVSKPRSPRKTPILTSPRHIPPSPSPMSSTQISSHEPKPTNQLSPEISIPSSPGFQIQAPNNVPEVAAPPPPLAQSPAAAPDPDPPPLPLSPMSASNPPLKLPSPINRPFKPPRTGSLLKKPKSDASSMRPPPPLPKHRSADKVLSDEVAREVMTEQTGSAWGKEAWDLFGCGRDGVECTYEEFKRKEGLL
ncbi:hypothetical protein N7G274_003378 [Stereocaulon virgatum]|uniref:5'-3' DNA helicase ZGRF1-like N-terminal domain-containing protein n=1 Tax=Stereocaulon virgatum TaxID=373712 RepID=A0ABR4ADM9_9LECA